MEDTTTLLDYIRSINMPMKEIASAANNFADENLIAQGSYAKVYKGQLLLQSGEWMNIVVRECLQPNRHIVSNNLMMYKNLKHTNIISLLRIDDTNPMMYKTLKHKSLVSPFRIPDTVKEAFLIHEYQVNESLDKHLSGSVLTWMQRLQICVGVAHALRYLHSGLNDDYSVIHGNIKSSKVLLNQEWEPKLHDFRCAMKGKRHELYLTSKYNGTLQYMDPAFERTGGLTCKSDVYSFGVVLFEVLFGRKASVADKDYGYFARLAKLHYEENRLDDMIDPDLRKQMDIESLSIFSETAYRCLMEQRASRPDIEQILIKLEKALQLQVEHQSLVHSTAAAASNRLKGRDIDHLRIRLKDIEMATDNFSEKFYVGSGGYGTVYKAELEHFDGMNSLATEWKDKGEIPKRRSTVAIKHISKRVDGQGEQGFIVEIELLSKCKHTNIVSLLGFCDEGPEMILVYEYASNGSLDNYLGNINNMTHFTWAQRIQICLDIANGLKYLHTRTHDKETIIHRDIKSENILLDDNWVAKIADFGLSKLHHADQQGSTLVTKNIAGTKVYIDPVYQQTGKLKKESDVYSLGVVLFEIMCGRLAYDITFNETGLPFVARQCFEKGTLKELVDPKLKEIDENIYILNEGVNKDSLDTFSKIAYQCLAESQYERPTVEVIIKELEKALNFQKSNKDHLHMSLEDIKLATQNFSDDKCIEEGRYWKQYEGDLSYANVNNYGYVAVIAKRFDSKFPQGRHQFFTELKILFKCKHENIVSLVGYCNEMDERIIVYEHALNGRLDKHLDNANLTWMRRIKICIDVACGLEFLHTGGVRGGISIIHRDIKTSSILLDGDWKAKISNLELSSQLSDMKEIEHINDDNTYSSLNYVCPEYKNWGYLRKESDIFSLGVILAEIFRGMLLWDVPNTGLATLLSSLPWIFLVSRGIKGPTDPKSLDEFLRITRQCVRVNDPRPEVTVVVRKLKKALEFQEDHEIWKSRLPIDYADIIRMSKNPESYDSIEMKKELYDKFSKGILLQDGKVWFSLGSSGAKNEMISARKFSYKNCRSRKWRSILESRFQKAAKMSDLSKLKIKINIKTQFLSPDLNYGVYLIFKFCDTIKFSTKPMYVNLNYKLGEENVHAYFATWRDENWMMIELCRFLSTKKDMDFEVLLESFSRYYCGRSSIYVEGIEFRAIDDVKHKKSQKIEEVLKLKSKEQQLSPNEVNKKKHCMLSAMEVLYDSSMKHFHSEPTESRFQEVIKLPPQQVFRISCKLQSQILSLDTQYVCYLVFKLSDKCRGLHCPVKVRDLLHRKNKEAEIIYFKPPRSWNLHDSNSVPEQREDGWTEVQVWKFVTNDDFKKDYIRVNLKLITYEGTMSGLIVRGLEIRSM